MDNQLSLHHQLKEYSFPPLTGLDTLAENQLIIGIWVYFWTLSSIPLVYMSILMQVPCCFNLCSFIMSFEIGTCEFSSFVLFQDSFAIQGPLHFHINSRINMSISAKKVVGIFIRITFNLQIKLWSTVILTALNLSVHKHRCLHFYFYLLLEMFGSVLCKGFILLGYICLIIFMLL